MRFEEIKMIEAMEIEGGMIGPVMPNKIAIYVASKVVAWIANR